jgi:periplasmic protein CpxP/Spy
MRTAKVAFVETQSGKACDKKTPAETQARLRPFGLGGTIQPGENKMRTALAIAAIVSLAAGTAFAQQDVKPSELGAIQHPPIQVDPATPPSSADEPKLPDAAPVINSEEPAAAKIESEEQAKAKIESEGFTEVSELKENDRGMWTATAMKDGKSVQLSLNAEGQISLLN